VTDRLDTRARELLAARERATQLARDADDAKAEKEVLEAQFWSLMKDMGLKSTTIDLGGAYGTVRLERRRRTDSRVLDREALVAALRERGLDPELVKAEPRKAQLNNYVRTILESGGELPEGLDFVSREYVSVTMK